MTKQQFLAKLIYLMEKGREGGDPELTPLLHCANIMQAAAKMNMEEPLAAFMAQFVRLIDYIEPIAIEAAKKQLKGEVVAKDPLTGSELQQTASGLYLPK